MNLFFFLFVVSIYLIISFIFFSSCLSSFPFNNSETEMPNTLDNGINNEITINLRKFIFEI